MKSEEIKRLVAKSENAAVEFKRARGGVPADFWPSYSSFANTDGGVIILGVRKKDDKREIEGLADTENVFSLVRIGERSDTLMSWFRKIPAGLDVLVSHSPPRIPGSDVDRSLQTDSEHFGSSELTEAIMEKRPRLVFCGHIHTGRNRPLRVGATHGEATKPSEASAEHGGVDFEGSRVYNVSRLDERYEIAYEPTWVEV